MIYVVEHGENIGTLRNIFADFQQALVFAKRLISFSGENYTCVAPNKWYCQKKNEYVEIEFK
jgi:hypothetical protein